MSEESSEPLAEPHEFRAQILAEYPDDFARFRDVLATLEHAIGSQESVQLSTELHRAMDMIMLQAYKSLCSVYVLVVRAHFEDAATICRRLMELAAQAGYIVEIEEDAEQNRRAGGYLASLWEAAPPQLRANGGPGVRHSRRSLAASIRVTSTTKTTRSCPESRTEARPILSLTTAAPLCRCARIVMCQ